MTWSSNNSDGARGWRWAEIRATSAVEEARREEARQARHLKEVEEAYERGFRDGRARARAAARAELASALQTLVEAVSQVRAHREAWAAQLEQDLAALSGAIAQVLVGREVQTDPRVVSELTRRAVAHFPTDEPLRIRLNPEDLQRLESVGETEEVTGARTVRWIPDDEIVPGGCVVEGPDKVVDGRLDEAVRRIVRRLVDA